MRIRIRMGSTTYTANYLVWRLLGSRPERKWAAWEKRLINAMLRWDGFPEMQYK